MSYKALNRTATVAPLVGAWIEMYHAGCSRWKGMVAPLVGAWIEIDKVVSIDLNVTVAPLVGAWIEMKFRNGAQFDEKSLLL